MKKSKIRLTYTDPPEDNSPKSQEWIDHHTRLIQRQRERLDDLSRRLEKFKPKDLK